MKKSGIDAAPTYTSLIYHQVWFRERITFGSSKYPWTLVDREYDYDQCCPIAEKSMEDHIWLSFHEDFSEEDITYVAEKLIEIENKRL